MIVISRSYGQLGNRLFLYGHLIAAAAEYGVTLSNPCFAEYAHLFPATANDLWCRYPVEPLPDRIPSQRIRKLVSKSTYLAARSLSLVGLSRGPVRVIRLKGEETCDLGGHDFAAAAWSGHVMAQGWLFRSERLIQKHVDKVRDHFRIAESNQRVVDRLIASLRDQSDVVVGIHVRQGDYATFMDGRYFYSVSQYVEIMRTIIDQLAPRRVAFLVCGNGELNPRDFTGLRVRFGSGEMIEDLYALSAVDLLVGPPSTFTGWASFYGDVPLAMIESADEPIDARSLLPQNVVRVA
jgi:hypothetical protein